MLLQCDKKRKKKIKGQEERWRVGKTCWKIKSKRKGLPVERWGRRNTTPQNAPDYDVRGKKKACLSASFVAGLTDMRGMVLVFEASVPFPSVSLFLSHFLLSSRHYSVPSVHPPGIRGCP